MKDYNNAFLGVILAGVLMLVTGLSLLIRPSVISGEDDSLTTDEKTIGLPCRTRLADGSIQTRQTDPLSAQANTRLRRSSDVRELSQCPNVKNFHLQKTFTLASSKLVN